MHRYILYAVCTAYFANVYGGLPRQKLVRITFLSQSSPALSLNWPPEPKQGVEGILAGTTRWQTHISHGSLPATEVAFHVPTVRLPFLNKISIIFCFILLKSHTLWGL